MAKSWHRQRDPVMQQKQQVNHSIRAVCFGYYTVSLGMLCVHHSGSIKSKPNCLIISY